MSHLGLKYDTSQTQLVNRFAEEVGSQERLDLLFLVTCADLAGVGPDVLSSWKVEVLSELYVRASRQLAAGSGAAVDGKPDSERSATWQLLTAAERDDSWFERHLAGLPESYISKRPPGAVVDTLRRLRRLEPRAG